MEKWKPVSKAMPPEAECSCLPAATRRPGSRSNRSHVLSGVKVPPAGSRAGYTGGKQGPRRPGKESRPPSWGGEGAGSSLRASLTSVEPGGGLREASGGARGLLGGGWGRAPARRTPAAAGGAPDPKQTPNPEIAEATNRLSRQARGRARLFLRK